MKKKLLVLTLALAMISSLFVFTSCGKKEAASTSDLEYVQGNGKLVVGITDFAPMDYKDDKGNWIGFDADMATAFAKELGVKVEFIEIDWDSKEMELENKSIDCVWNGMTLTDAVKKAMATSNPYCDNAQIVVLNSSIAPKYEDKDACKDLKFAVEKGSAGEQAAKDAGYKYTAVETQANAVMEVSAGTADACIIDSLMAAAMVGEGTSYPDLTYTVKLTSEQYGVGFRKGSDLAAKLNEFLVKAYGDGSMQKIAETYKVQAAIIEQK